MKKSVFALLSVISAIGSSAPALAHGTQCFVESRCVRVKPCQDVGRDEFNSSYMIVEKVACVVRDQVVRLESLSAPNWVTYAKSTKAECEVDAARTEIRYGKCE